MRPRSTSQADSPSLPELCFTSPGIEATRAAARALALATDSAGLVLALVGPLGSGKTLFVKGLAEGLGIDPASVTSPTFVIAAEYDRGRRHLHHLDLYRLQSVAELEQVGYLDLLDTGAVVAIEWADRFPQELPRDCLTLEIEAVAAERRRFRANARGAVATAAQKAWGQALGSTPVELEDSE